MRTLKNLSVTVVQAQYNWKWFGIDFSTLLFLTTILVFCHSRNVNFQLKLVRNVGKRKAVCQKAKNYN